ncbi:MAG TPA: diguanylate cyclase [Solirubrobacteraceae bacterium]
MRILIAEDSPTERAVLERTLSTLDHSYMAAETGDQAWQLFQDHGADVVISDWMMPGLNGDELCRRIRAHSASYTYLILLTSLEDTSHVARGMEAGADDYLRKPFGIEELHARLIAAERVTGLHQRIADQQGKLEELNRRLFEESRHDPLTGLGNRNALDDQLGQLSAMAARYGHTYCVALFDLDYFKAYNDTSGHVAGDQVLKTVADTLKRESRKREGVYRFGGEELLVVLPEQTIDTAARAAERLREAVQRLGIPHPARLSGSIVTVSAGVAQLQRADAGMFDAVLDRADQALYRAKRLGRNRVEVGLQQDASPPGPIRTLAADHPSDGD